MGAPRSAVVTDGIAGVGAGVEQTDDARGIVSSGIPYQYQYIDYYIQSPAVLRKARFRTT